MKSRAFSAGVIPTRQLVAPAGSNRSGDGGNEIVEAFDDKGSLGDSASRQAVTLSERRAGLEKGRCGSRPAYNTGKAAVVEEASCREREARATGSTVPPG